MRLVLSAERLSLFAEHRVLSVVRPDPFVEHLALFPISRALISRDMFLPATVGGILSKIVQEHSSWQTIDLSILYLRKVTHMQPQGHGMSNYSRLKIYRLRT